MISDVLGEAISRIEDWQVQLPDAYGAWDDQIERVKEAMALLMVRLDTPPELTPERWAEATILRLADEPGFRERLDAVVYRVKRADVVHDLGERHPLIERLAMAESGGGRQVPDPSLAS